ncbi:MAG: hypothetical protein RMJ17_02040 [Candidatus Aenigmarchaeota archaeon]|nr:hypothetical protein [Candidatus Aenigmarchaeota archaeon]MDW8149354.1 hypothetical protein [Candidatus Aenigmarchaeota archaeon]
MNNWVKKSIKLVQNYQYLDKLLEIYPPEEIERDKLNNEDLFLLEQFFKNKDNINLIKKLIELKKKKFKFPIEHPYIGFLTHCEDAIEKNPKTIQKISDKLFQMNFNQLKEKLEAPKKASRRIGPMFKNWLKSKFNFLPLKEFENSLGLVFLEGNDEILKRYATQKLKCRFSKLSKGLDFIAKFKNKYLIGTAKFITDFGGSQDNQFIEAIRLIQTTYHPNNVIIAAIIDGVAWLKGKKIKKKKKSMREILEKLKKDEFCFTALLLEDFLNSFFIE